VLLEEVQQHIKQAGLEAIADLKGENIHIDFVENMLAVHKKYRDLIQVKKRKEILLKVGADEAKSHGYGVRFARLAGSGGDS
jgi:cullin 2